MKKKLLFVIPSLRSGGAEKSLTTLLQLLDYAQYDVDLFLFRQEGLFLPLVPEEVRILNGGEDYRMFDGPAKPALLYFLRRGQFRQVLRRIRYGRMQKRPDANILRKNWQTLSSFLPKLEGYDTAIAYLEGPATYFTIERVKADKKIAFLHIDYDFIHTQAAMDRPYYAQIDRLVSVSEECCSKAVSYFPFLEGKVECMYNITSPTLVRKMAEEAVGFPPAHSGLTLLTVGRLTEQKGLDWAIEACAILAEKGLDFCWYHIGVGHLEQTLKAQAQSLGVQDRFIFLGEKSNPYPYIRACDVFVQPSRFEGKSIAIDEAKCLAKPILVTDFGTVFDQITDGVNGVIVHKTPQDIADGLEKLMRSPDLRETLSENLRQESVGTEEEIHKFLAML